MPSDHLKLTFTKLFEPQSVAFIGATDTPGKWGFTILHHIFQGGYQGRLYLVNPKRPAVFGHPCVKNLAEIEETPDLAVIVIPSEKVLATLDEVIAKGTRAAVVITSGFAEANEEGLKLQNQLVARAHEGGLRFVGPNSMGIVTSFPHRLISTMGSMKPRPGRVAVVAQSGNLGVTFMSRLERRAIGVSRGISTGNQASLAVADYLDMLADDPKTDIIAAYVEGVPDGRHFLEMTEKAARVKPVVFLKGGKGTKGAKAAKSHTAAVSGSHQVFLASVREAGGIVANSMDELINMIGAFHSNPVPKSNRAGILTLGGGWGVVGADSCERFGIDLPDLPPDVYKTLDDILPSYWSRGNPIDTVATTDISTIPTTLEELFRSDAFDNVLYLGIAYLAFQGRRYMDKGPAHGPLFDKIGQFLVNTEYQMLDRIVELRNAYGKPFFPVADLVSRDEVFPENIVHALEERGIFVYNAPWQAAHGLAALLERANWLKRAQTARTVDVAPDRDALVEAQRLVRNAVGGKRRQLAEHESKRLLAALRLPTTRESEAASVEEAVEAARLIGYPVALKVSSADILHKSEVGGVALNLATDAEVRRHADRLLKQGKVLVQRMAPASAVELLVGLTHDRTFGPALVFGKGGVETEVWADTATLPAPVTPDQAERMIDATRMSKLIAPFRGRPALDRAALVDLLVKVSRLPELFPEVRELDINPLFLYEKGAMIVDAKIVLKNGDENGR
ncbi:MAG: CoA-binding protein [Myxococcales bacterium]|nr:MAG: CoA-binding protein [Myxococcales bacterium]